MAGLVPAIHVFDLTHAAKTWMPATSAGMTNYLSDQAKIAFCDSFPRFLIDFRLRSHRASKPCDPMFHGNKAVASMTYNVSRRPLQRPHLTTVAASF
jgi:hypothetical protein